MSKAADIQQDTIDAVVGLERKYGDGHHSFELRDGIFALILAAKAEERQSVIAWLDTAREGLNKLAEEYDAKDNRVQAERCIVRAAAHSIAVLAIRSGDHVNTAHKNSEEV